MKKFRALIIGNDINAYYLARCYHEFTGEKADLLSIITVSYTHLTLPTN